MKGVWQALTPRLCRPLWVQTRRRLPLLLLWFLIRSCEVVGAHDQMTKFRHAEARASPNHIRFGPGRLPHDGIIGNQAGLLANVGGLGRWPGSRSASMDAWSAQADPTPVLHHQVAESQQESRGFRPHLAAYESIAPQHASSIRTRIWPLDRLRPSWLAQSSINTFGA